MKMIRINWPMPYFGRNVVLWKWPSQILSKYEKCIRNGDQIWIDATSDRNQQLIDDLKMHDLPTPAATLIGVSTKREIGQFRHFNFVATSDTELMVEGDNFEAQLSCGLVFPPLRHSNLGCESGKRRTRLFRAPSRWKHPKKDIFRISAGPRLSQRYFGVSKRAKEIFEGHSTSGIQFQDILNFDGGPSGYFEAFIAGTARPRDPCGQFDLRRMCQNCGLYEYGAKHSEQPRIIRPFPEILEPLDFQVSDRFLLGDQEVTVSIGVPIVSRRVIELYRDHAMSGLTKGSAGDYEPLITVSDICAASIDPQSLLNQTKELQRTPILTNNQGHP